MFLLRILSRHRWFNCSTSVMILLLQRTPFLRALVSSESDLVSPATNLVRSLFVAAAATAGIDTLSGASTYLVSNINLPAQTKTGQSFTMAIIIQGLGVSYAQSWDITNTLPPGITPKGATLASGKWVIPQSDGTLYLIGAATASGTYNFTVEGYQYTNRTGPVTSGSTSIVVTASVNSPPSISAQPNDASVLTGANVSFSVTASGTPSPTYQWMKDSSPVTGAVFSTLSLTNVEPSAAGTYSVKITNSAGSVLSRGAVLTVSVPPAPPAFTTQPTGQTITAGDSVTLTTVSTGAPAPTLQWSKNGTPLAGAVSATYTISSAQVSDSGDYDVVATNASGSLASNTATIVVNPVQVAPHILAQPLGVSLNPGQSAAFDVAASGAPAPTFQWLKDGTPISGATGPGFLLANVAPGDAGNYSVQVTNSLGTVTSEAGALQIVSGHPASLVNLSVRTSLASSQLLTVGFVSNGAKSLLIRTAGPALANLGVPGTNPDPKITLFDGTSTRIDSNDNWDSTLAPTFATLGAFGFTPGSLDAALLHSVTGANTAEISGNGSGVVLVEVYDADTAGASHLVNLSARNIVGTGDNILIAGFVVNGSSAETLLIRGIGPKLADFNINGVLADPVLSVHDHTGALIAANDNWDQRLASTFATLGAFGLNPGSKDSAMAITLPSGTYTAELSGVAGTTGDAIIEVYAMP